MLPPRPIICVISMIGRDWSMWSKAVVCRLIERVRKHLESLRTMHQPIAETFSKCRRQWSHVWVDWHDESRYVAIPRVEQLRYVNTHFYKYIFCFYVSSCTVKVRLVLSIFFITGPLVPGVSETPPQWVLECIVLNALFQQEE